MRVLMIAPAPFDYDRGKSIRIRQTVRHLSQLGYDLEVLTYPTGRTPDVDGVDITRAPELFQQDEPSLPGLSPKEIFSNLAIEWRAVQRLRNGEYDVIHAHDVDGALIGQMARRLARVNIPLIYDMHGTFQELSTHYDIVNSKQLVHQVEQYLYDSADYLIANWPHILDEIDTDTPSSLILDEPDQTVCSHLETLRSGNTDIEHPEELEDTRYILYTGNYASYQGIDLLYDAFNCLDINESVQLVMTGDAPEEYIVDNSDIIYTGFVSETRLAELLYDADVLVSPRQTDGFPPMKILYYIRTDNPIVATDRMCHKSVIQESANAWFAEETPAMFAQALKDALTAGPTDDRDTISTDMTEQYEAIYEEIIS